MAYIVIPPLNKIRITHFQFLTCDKTVMQNKKKNISNLKLFQSYLEIYNV